MTGVSEVRVDDAWCGQSNNALHLTGSAWVNGLVALPAGEREC